MAFVWQERTHNDNEERNFNDLGCRRALLECRLRKFFLTPHLRAQLDLLELLIRSRNPTDEKFIIRGKDIEFYATDIYFLTRLSHRGERPILEGQRVVSETLDMLIAWVCPGAHKSATNGKLQIPTVDDLTLRSVLFMVTRTAGSQAQHEATKTHLWLALECLNPTMYNWAEAMAVNMKRQLTRCRCREAKQFGYGSILIPLMVEQVPVLQLQDMDLYVPGPRETHITRWAHVMPRGGGSRPVS